VPEIGTPGLMSGDGKRGVAEWLKLPRPSSTLPQPTSTRGRNRMTDSRRLPQNLISSENARRGMGHK
jgi:hypothetical protein